MCCKLKRVKIHSMASICRWAVDFDGKKQYVSNTLRFIIESSYHNKNSITLLALLCTIFFMLGLLSRNALMTRYQRRSERYPHGRRSSTKKKRAFIWYSYWIFLSTFTTEGTGGYVMQSRGAPSLYSPSLFLVVDCWLFWLGSFTVFSWSHHTNCRNLIYALATIGINCLDLPNKVVDTIYSPSPVDFSLIIEFTYKRLSPWYS